MNAESKSFRDIPVSWILNGLIVALLGFAATGSLSRMSAGVARWSDTTATHQATIATKEIFAALGSLRLERGTALGAIQGTQPTSAATLAELQRLRAVSAKALDEVAGSCAAIECESGIVPERLSALRQTIDLVRGEIDLAAQKSLNERNSGLEARWQQALAPLLDALQARSAMLSMRIRLTDADVAEQLSIKELGWTARDAAGLERNPMVAALASGTLSQEQLGRMMELRGRTAAAWTMLKELVARPGLAPKVVAAVEEAERIYLGDFVAMRARVQEALLAGRPAPVSQAEYVQASNRALNTLIAIPTVALDAMDEIAGGEARGALEDLIVQSAILLVTLMLGGTGILVIRSRVIMPVLRLTESLRRLASGDSDVEIPASARRDELGTMAEAARQLRVGVIERIERHARMEKITREFEGAAGAVVVSVQGAARELAAGTMTGTADQTLRQAAAVAALSREASAGVHTVAAAGQELAVSVDEIMRQVGESADLVNRAVREAEQTNQHVTSLGSAAARISGVVDLIREIADQTNLLALNATIEAARAGDAGRGFAVVASEVKSLAGQTAKATGEIGGQIESVRRAMEDSARSMSAVSSLIADVQEATTRIATAVEEQGAATKDIARSTTMVSAGTEKVAETIQEIDQAASEAAQAAGQVRGAAGGLAGQATGLSREVTEFLARVRAA